MACGAIATKKYDAQFNGLSLGGFYQFSAIAATVYIKSSNFSNSATAREETNSEAWVRRRERDPRCFSAYGSAHAFGWFTLVAILILSLTHAMIVLHQGASRGPSHSAYLRHQFRC